MYNVYYEWVNYKDKEGNEKKFVAYCLVIGGQKINITAKDSKDSTYNRDLLESCRKLGLLKKYEKDN